MHIEASDMIIARADGGGLVLFIIIMAIVSIVNWVKKTAATSDERPSLLTPDANKASPQPVPQTQEAQELAKFLESLGVPVSRPEQPAEAPPVLPRPAAMPVRQKKTAQPRRQSQSARDRRTGKASVRPHPQAAVEPVAAATAQPMQSVWDSAPASVHIQTARPAEKTTPFTRQAVREAIMAMEILDKPVALRQLNRQGVSPICTR